MKNQFSNTSQPWGIEPDCLLDWLNMLATGLYAPLEEEKENEEVEGAEKKEERSTYPEPRCA